MHGQLTQTTNDTHRWSYAAIRAITSIAGLAANIDGLSLYVTVQPGLGYNYAVNVDIINLKYGS